MSNLFDFQKYETTFVGKPVTMEIRPLKSREMIQVLPIIAKINKKMKEQPELKDKLRFDDEESITMALSVQDKVKDIVPNAVRNLEGIDDNWTVICEEFYYLPFVLELVLKLTAISQIGEPAIKN